MASVNLNQAADYPAAIAPLQAGQLAVIPTDTLYGVVCSARLPAAVERLYALRQRDSAKPCILLISDPAELAEVGVELTAAQRTKLGEYWPGPVSVVLGCPGDAWEYLHRGQRTLAVRQPATPALRALLRQTGPLLAPSANPADRPPAASVAEARAYFGDAVAVYVDGGSIAGKPSRLITLNADGQVAVLRP